jgi:hypothetical protein
MKGILASILFFIVTNGEAQLGIMKMVGHNTGNYSYGIHQLDCSIGALILIQPDLEGFGQDIYRFYGLRVPGELKWFDMK